MLSFIPVDGKWKFFFPEIENLAIRRKHVNLINTCFRKLFLTYLKYLLTYYIVFYSDLNSAILPDMDTRRLYLKRFFTSKQLIDLLWWLKLMKLNSLSRTGTERGVWCLYIWLFSFEFTLYVFKLPRCQIY